MARVPKDHNEGYNDAFPARLRLLLLITDTSQVQLAGALGVTPQTVSLYATNNSKPEWKTIVKIADYFDVSTDYLLGRTDVPSPDAEMQELCQYTGLSDIAIGYLHNLQETTRKPPKSERLNLLDHLLSLKQFDLFLAYIERYIALQSREVSPKYRETPEFSACKEMLEKHGYVIANSKFEASVLFQEQIAPTLHAMLDFIAGLNSGGDWGGASPYHPHPIMVKKSGDENGHDQAD